MVSSSHLPKSKRMLSGSLAQKKSLRLPFPLLASMNQNIRSLSQVAQNYEFVDVDAVSALKAKREGKQGLLADSNIRELEYCISNKLASVDSIQMLCTPLENMARLCEQIKKSLELAIDDGNSKMLSKLKQELYEKKESASREFSVAIGSVVDSFSERIYQKASANRSIDAAEQEYIVFVR